MAIIRRTTVGAYSMEAAQHDIVADSDAKDGPLTLIQAAMDYQSAKTRFATLSGLWRSITGEEFKP